ncbi:MAG TPA: hypothetical protein PKE45_04815 [Caldilineaceae bacterium]|nr:hypothetical protein [Caldilineaceae bacterium]
MRARLLRLGQLLLVLLLILVVALLIPVVAIGVMCDPFAEVRAAAPTPLAVAEAWPQAATRPEDQTYLTLPEWYIVYSADEYAAYLQDHPPSSFPYFAAIGQYWRSYRDVCGVTRGHYPFNVDYHLTLYVIGVSFTVENSLRGIYETSMGRVIEWLSSGQPTAEERYGRQVAVEYGRFIHTIPWYEFPFAEKLNTLWTTTGWWGPDPLRKWERKFVLSLEYGGKALYARLIKGGTQAAYAPERLEVLAVAEGVTPELVANNPDLHVVKTLAEGKTLISLPRYEAFSQLAPKLTQQGLRFVAIAGNDEIMLTAFAPQDWLCELPVGDLLFELPILTRPGEKRVALTAPVASLHKVLAELQARGLKLEHLYDY